MKHLLEEFSKTLFKNPTPKQSNREIKLSVVTVCTSYAHIYVHMSMCTHLQKPENLK